MALYYSLGTERYLEVAVHALKISADPVGRAGIERRTQHQKLVVSKMREHHIDTLLNDMAFRIEKFIDRRADRDDHRPRIRYLAWLTGEDQSLVAKRARQQSIRAMFNERQAAGLESGEIVKVQIVDVDGETL